MAGHDTHQQACHERLTRPGNENDLRPEMTTMNSNTKHTGGSRAGAMIAAALLGVAMLTISAADTQAQSTFTVNISEKEQKLAHPTDMMWDKHLMWDLGFQRMNDRNMPYVELRNTGTAPITEYRMTIGDTRFNFTNESLGTYALLGSTTPGFQLTSNAISGDELVVMIGNGGLPVGQLQAFGAVRVFAADCGRLRG
jgi:hypothetical protein